jgi:serine/threonine protein kinase/tetratricopeptide (TPR) repeat protein
MRPRSETEPGNGLGDFAPNSTSTSLSDSSTAAKPEIPPGQTALSADPFIGRILLHYRLEEALAAGGMGVLYRATDLKLGRSVAIKLLARHLVSDEIAKARFVREARAASALDHPNIATVHEIGEEEGELFIAMALYEGETLKQRLEKGKLAVEEALDVLRQVAVGLEAAHLAGIVHRDIKPANLLMTSSGIVKILDFGLAKLISEPQAQTMTQAGQAMGTMLYMSPEQLRGEAVDSRSDLWSLGVLAYELLAGVSPFQTDSAAATAASILHDEPSSLASVPGIPNWLAQLVSHLLQKNPSDRPQTARELARKLEAQAKIQGGPAVGTPYRRRILAAAAFAAMLVLFSILIAKGPRLFWRAPGTPTDPAPLTLLVADFKNATSDPIFEGTFESILTVAMEGASFINAYKRQDARKIAAQLELHSASLDERAARLVALREGIGTIVSGSIRPDRAGYVLAVRAIAAREGKPIVEREVGVANKAEVLPALGRLAAVVRSALGDTTPEAAQLASLETFTAGSLEAAHEYAAAQDLQHRGRAEEALLHYAKAVEFDPKLGRAYAGMAVVNLNLHRRRDAALYFQKALALLDRMTERERYRTRGTYYVFEHDYEKAVDEYEAMVSRFPSDEVGFLNLAVAHCYRRDMQKALVAGNRALQLAPANVLNRANLAVYAMYSSDFEKAIQLAREVVEANPAHLTPRVVIGLSEVASGRPGRALEAYQALARVSKAGASLAAQGIADLELYQGRPQEAVAALQRQLALDEADNPSAAATKLVTLASAQLAVGQPTAAMKAADHAVTISKADSIMLLAARAYLDGGNEKKALALAADLRARRAPEPRAYARLIEGNAALKRGDAVAAIRLLREAQRTFDTWIGRFDLGRAYLGARAFTEAHEELDACLKRRGEATALFIDEVPTARYLSVVHYYMAKAQDGLKSPAAAESYRAFLSAKDGAAPGDALIEDAKRSSHTR